MRDGEGLLTHAGILFDSRHSPYHQLDQKVEAEHPLVLGNSRPIPAVTGALMLIRRNHFTSLRFGTHYRVCGEDVGLCLDLRQKLGLEVWYCPGFSGLHEAESTRSKTPEQQGNTEDLSTMRQLHREFIEAAKKPQLRQELMASVAEAEALRTIKEPLESIEAIKEELRHWRDNSHTLQLLRLQLEQKLQIAQRGGK